MRKVKKRIKIEKVFLVLSIIFGSIFSFVFSLFYEADAQFHFDYATYQANVVVNRVEVGGSPGLGYENEVAAVADGDYFEKFFVTKAERIDKKQVFDQRVIEIEKSFTSDVQHIIPALGVFIGYHIYPSVGAMIVTARLLQVIFYSLAVYFVIKFVRYGKTLFLLTALSPVMVVQSYSLSYDSISFVFTSLLVATQINYFYRASRKLWPVMLASLALILFTKANMYLLLLLTLLAVIDKFFDLEKIKKWILKYKFILIPVSLIIILVGYYLFAATHGGTKLFTFRMFNTIFSVENEQYTRGMLLGILGNFSASYSLPWWCLIGYSLVFGLCIFGEKKPPLSPIVSSVGISVFFLNIFGTTALYSTFENSVSDPANPNQIIGGQLGRYYTPLLPLLLYFENLTGFSLELKDQFIEKVASLWTLLCLVLLTVITIYGFYVLQVPAFVQ